MPRYYYHCESCGGEFEVRHGMSETLHGGPQIHRRMIRNDNNNEALLN
jgi:putative FmdB family regulatory protein